MIKTETELKFKEVELADKTWIDRCMKESDFRGNEYSFTNNYIWRKVYQLKVAHWGDLYLQWTGSDGSHGSFAFPAGKGDVKSAIEQLIEFCGQQGQEFRMMVSTRECVNQLETWFPGKFEFHEKRDYFDYVYLAEKLKTFAGKKLHSKRNFVNRFTQTYDWSVEELTTENIEQCFAFNKIWCSKNNCCQDESKREEMCATNAALKNFSALALKGCILKISGEVVAYSVGERINSDTFIVHIEKADADIPGAYPMICQQMVKMHAGDCVYVNREEDLGVEGLRKAKMSFYPDLFVERYEAILK